MVASNLRFVVSVGVAIIVFVLATMNIIMSVKVSVGGSTTHNYSSDTPQRASQPNGDEPVKKKKKKKRPNILLILADDVGTSDVTGYWNNCCNVVDMPNLQALQDKGVTFHDAHSTPLCAPSRYMILSGNYPHRGRLPFGTWGFKDAGNQFHGGQQSVAGMLKEKGNYRTAMLGKWHVGGKVPGTYNHKHVLSCCDNDWSSKPMVGGPNDIGFDESYYTIGGIQGAPYSFFRDGYLTTKVSDIKYWEKGTYKTENNGTCKIDKPGEGDPSWDTSQYNTKLVHEANIFLDKQKMNQQHDPFFLYFALGQVHIPHAPPAEYMDGTKIAGRYANSHLDLLFEMDKVIGSLVSKLEETDMIEDTLIIFASDNGGLDMGDEDYPERHLRGFKGSNYEGGHRVPFVMRYDGVLPAGENRTTRYVSLADLYATLAEFAGVEPNRHSAQDSRSFASYAASESSADLTRTHLPTWHMATNNFAGSIRYGDFKFIRNFDVKLEALYNLKDDIRETTNLLATDFEKYEPLRDRLRSKLREEGQCPLDKLPSKRGGNSWNSTDCEWFSASGSKRKTRERCQSRIDGALLCNSVCGRFRSLCKHYDEDEAEYLESGIYK